MAHPEPRALVQVSSLVFTQEEAAAVSAVEADEADFSDMDANEQQWSDFEETHAPGGPRRVSVSPQRPSGELPSERASVTPPAKKTRTSEQYVGNSGDPPVVQAQRLSALALHISRDEELMALTQRAGNSYPATNQSLEATSGMDVRSCLGCLPDHAWQDLARLL